MTQWTKFSEYVHEKSDYRAKKVGILNILGRSTFSRCTILFLSLTVDGTPYIYLLTAMLITISNAVPNKFFNGPGLISRTCEFFCVSYGLIFRRNSRHILAASNPFNGTASHFFFLATVNPSGVFARWLDGNSWLITFVVIGSWRVSLKHTNIL